MHQKSYQANTMQSEETNTLVKLAKAVIEHAPEGGGAFWGIKFSDIEAALSAAEPQPAPPVAVKLDSIAHRVHALARMVGTSFFEDVEKDLRDLSAALSAQVQEVAGDEQIMNTWKKLRELEGKLPHALGMIVGDALDELRPIIARIQSAAPAKQEG